MPKAYQKVIEAFNDPYCSPRTIGKMISSDIGLSTKILQVANSGFQGGAVKIVDPIRAVVHLGLKAVEALVLTSGIFSKLSDDLVKRFFVEGLQEHCARVGMYSRMICESFNMEEEDLETATMAGILHDTGKMVLIAKFPEEYSEAIEKSRRTKVSLCDIERDILGFTHCELGGSLLELWGLPNNIIECATYHQEIENSVTEGTASINSAVYLANLLDHEMVCLLGGGYSGCEEESKLKLYDMYDLWERWKRITVPFEYSEVLNVT
jgi:putative nucleotidyltransferase with HDIG domain